MESWSEAALVERESTLRKDTNKALEASHNSAEARDLSPKNIFKRQRKKKGSGDGTEVPRRRKSACRVVWGMPSTSIVATLVTWCPYALARPRKRGARASNFSLRARGLATRASSAQQW